MIEKIDKIQELLHVPNIDESTETAINNMKILNLLVDLRAEAQQLILSGVLKSFCECKGSGGIRMDGTCGRCTKPLETE